MGELNLYFAYIDESGTVDLNDPSSKEYVRTAVIIHEQDWSKVQEACRELKFEIWEMLNDKSVNEPPIDFELHMKEICDREGYFECLEGDDTYWFSIVDEIYTRISWINTKIICSIIIKDEFIKTDFEDVHKWAFTLLVERLRRFMEKNHPELDEYILLVIDTVNPVFDVIQREHLKEFITFGTGHGWIEYPTQVIETPFIVDSHVHNVIQLADAIRYLIRCHVFSSLNRNPEAFFNRYSDNFIKKINHLFYRSKSNRLNNVGVKIFPHTFNVGKKFWNTHSICN